MTQYLLSTHCLDGEIPEPMPEADMRRIVGGVMALQEEMKSTGTWVFGGRLHDADTATVVRKHNGQVLTTDGPFVEAKEHLGGFYIIEAEDLDAALAWAARVTELIGAPIEVRPFVPEPSA